MGGIIAPCQPHFGSSLLPWTDTDRSVEDIFRHRVRVSIWKRPHVCFCDVFYSKVILRWEHKKEQLPNLQRTVFPLFSDKKQCGQTNLYCCCFRVIERARGPQKPGLLSRAGGILTSRANFFRSLLSGQTAELSAKHKFPPSAIL